jgi:hypothetical protein
LKNWIAQQEEREKEAADRKRRKLERLQEQPKHNFHDQTYEKERSQLTENVSDAVEQGTSSSETILYIEIYSLIVIMLQTLFSFAVTTVLCFSRLSNRIPELKLE